MTLIPRDRSQRTWSRHTILRRSITHSDLFSLSSPCNLYHNALFATCLEWFCPRLYSAVSISQRGLWPLTASKGPGAVALEDCHTWHQANRYMQKIVKGAPLHKSCIPGKSESYLSYNAEVKFQATSAQELLPKPKHRVSSFTPPFPTPSTSYHSPSPDGSTFLTCLGLTCPIAILTAPAVCQTHCVSLDSITIYLLYCFQGDPSKMFL